MKRISKKTAVSAVLSLLLIGFSVLIVHNYKTKTSFKYNLQNAENTKPEHTPQDVVSAAVNEDKDLATQDEIKIQEDRKKSELVKVISSDYVLGDKNAPVVFIEYASLSCPHCSAFVRESFEKLKSEYIDTGKIQFVYRNFPLNQPALTAAMLSECQAQDNKSEATEKYHDSIKVLMKTQDSWAFDPKFSEKLEAIAQLEGMSPERFKNCISNKSLQEKILSHRMLAAKSLQIKSTPSFFINGEISEGYVDYQTIKKLIDKKLLEVAK